MSNDFWVFPIDLYIYIFWVFVQILVCFGAGVLFNYLVNVIAQANFLTSKAVFRQMNKIPLEEISYDYGDMSWRFSMVFGLFILDVVYTVKYII
jgi:hypothetical protein